jgi:hypothetical protein
MIRRYTCSHCLHRSTMHNVAMDTDTDIFDFSNDWHRVPSRGDVVVRCVLQLKSYGVHISLTSSSETSVRDASARMLFEGKHDTRQYTRDLTLICPWLGSAITLYGSTGPDYGTFSISLDGSRALVLNGTAPIFGPNILLVSF